MPVAPSRGWWNQMNGMSVEKLWNDICGWGKRETLRKNLPRPCFIHNETHIGVTETQTRDPSGENRATNRLRHRVAKISYYVCISNPTHCGIWIDGVSVIYFWFTHLLDRSRICICELKASEVRVTVCVIVFLVCVICDDEEKAEGENRCRHVVYSCS